MSASAPQAGLREQPAGQGAPAGQDAPGDAYRRRWTWERVTWSSHCGNCIANCAYQLYARDGAAVAEEQSGGLPGFEGVPDMNPLGCQKGAAWQVQLAEGDRILRPLRRVGERGSGHFEPIGWDEAFDAISGAIVDAIEAGGPEAVLFEGGAEGGVLASMARSRLARAMGAVNLDGNATVSDVHLGHWMTFGNLLGGSGADDTFRSDVVIVWNGNPAFTRIPYFHYLPEARYRGATVVLIAPDYSPSAVHADLFVPVRPGTDAALALSVCQVIVSEGLADLDFVRSQTDMALLVRSDTGRFLRESDVRSGGREDGFFLWDEASGLADAPRDSLQLGNRVPALSGAWSVQLADGSTTEVTTVFALMETRLAGYEPEVASEICGVAPQTIRRLARMVTSGRTKLYNGLGSCKHYHGDLMERSMDLLLALSGNWGKPGTGFDTYIIALMEGEVLAMFKQRAGAQASEEAMDALDSVIAMLQAADPAMTEGKAFLELMRASATMTGSTPPAFFYYHHCGFAELWERPGYGDSPRSVGEYIAEAESEGWWSGLVRPAQGKPPRVLLQAGTNVLRRTRGGQRMLLANLWPHLDMVVTIDWRMSTSGLWSDIILPVACEGERVEIHAANSHSFERMLSDKAFEPAGESMAEWELFAALGRAIAARAGALGIDSFSGPGGTSRPYADLESAVTSATTARSDEAALDEVLRDGALSGNLPAGSSLDRLRETGWVRPAHLPRAMASVCGSDLPADSPFVAYRSHVEAGVPFETLTGRAQFYIDHPWFLEAGEELPCHKEPPAMGGDHPLRLTGGHPRWSIHATNTTSRLMLETTRGHPVVHVNPSDAEARGVVDEDLVEVFNDVGALRVAAKISPAVRPGQLVLYASWEQYLFAGWKDVTWVEPGVVKWLHFAGGYGHLGYSPMQWQPQQADRVYRVDLRLAAR